MFEISLLTGGCRGDLQLRRLWAGRSSWGLTVRESMLKSRDLEQFTHFQVNRTKLGVQVGLHTLEE